MSRRAALLPGAVVALQAFLALARRDGWSVLLAPGRGTWLLVLVLWAKDLVLAGLAGALAAAACRWVNAGDGTRGPARRAPLLAGCAASFAAGTTLRGMLADVCPPGQFSDTFAEIAHVLRDPSATWLGTTPVPGQNLDQISKLYARAAHALLAAFGGGDAGLLAIAAVPATLLLPAIAWLGAEAAGARAGAVAMGLAAASSWALDVGRWGFTGSAMLPLLAAGAAALLAGERTGRAAWGALGGALLGLALHTHPAAWAVDGLLALYGLAAAVS